MRTLNLQGLKRSKIRKHRAIYSKAKRIMEEGWETKELTEGQIQEMASKYPHLEVRVVMGGDILIKSKKDIWMVSDEVRFLALYHKGWTTSKGKFKEKYHIQDVFYDLEFILASIVSHDDYALGIDEKTTADLKKMVRENRIEQ